jgi:hypothetical protein
MATRGLEGEKRGAWSDWEFDCLVSIGLFYSPYLVLVVPSFYLQYKLLVSGKAKRADCMTLKQKKRKKNTAELIARCMVTRT